MKLHAFANEVSPSFVIPAKAGIQEKQATLDPGLRRGDDQEMFLRSAEVSYSIKLAAPAASG